MVASPFISLLFIEYLIFHRFLTLCIVFKIIYSHLAELVLGRLPGRSLEHWPTLILMMADPFILLLYIENHIFYHFWTFYIVLNLIYSHMAEPVLGLLTGRPLAHWPTLILMVPGPLYQYYGHIIAMPIRFVFLAVQCPDRYIWHSRIPGVPGIRTVWHSVPVPGMEAVGTL